MPESRATYSAPSPSGPDGDIDRGVTSWTTPGSTTGAARRPSDGTAVAIRTVVEVEGQTLMRPIDAGSGGHSQSSLAALTSQTASRTASLSRVPEARGEDRTRRLRCR